MRKMMVVLLVVMGFVLLAQNPYNQGQVILEEDNISLLIDGPSGHPEVGTSKTIKQIIDGGKPVFLFFGQDW